MKGSLVFPSAPQPYNKHPSVILHENKGLETKWGKKIAMFFTFFFHYHFTARFFISVLHLESYKLTCSRLKTHLKEGVTGII